MLVKNHTHVMEHIGAKKKRVPVDSIKEYYPVVVPVKQFHRVQEILSVSGEGRKTSAVLQNIFSYVAVCPICGASQVRIGKGGDRWVYLACSNAKNGMGCEYKAIPYQRLEEVFLSVLNDSLFDFPGGNERATEIARQLQSERTKLREVKSKHAALLREIEAVQENEGVRPGTLAKRLLDRKREIKAVEREIARLAMEHKETSPRSVDVIRKEFVAEMQNETQSRERLNMLVRGLFKSVVLDKIDKHNVQITATYKSGPVLVCNYNDTSYSRRYESVI